MRRILIFAITLALVTGSAFANKSGPITPPFNDSSEVDSTPPEWWVVVSTGPGSSSNVPESVKSQFGNAVKASVAACGYMTFHGISGLFTGFSQDEMFEVYAIGGYPTKAAAQRVLDTVKPCMPTSYLKNMSLQHE